ncbi:class I SAM-dependent methyltransferase family protein [Micromonospora sp. WMMD882]|uniref:class I SAM-dependent methyltransferase family protein n=1 Tax=Micromonospora sp. WMMD882 TaxID=3015151 RepID=UPI00248D00E7|nr:class I SAM-dependent methyltransferase family protein [Micromonospora sp. WMMD882]WBB81935.1 class I SAM-dependent methyltransferase family protein [Micromonospora sp. WMMD882]
MVPDWYAWHTDYDQPESALSRRLAEVRRQVGAALDRAPAGPLRALSLCAGQGRDLIPVLAEHPRRVDVTARLVELDARNAGLAAEAARAAGLTGVEVVRGDAADTDVWADLVPAEIVLVCGLFGNVSDADVRAVARHCGALCATGGTVVWTRHREAPDLVPAICDWFAEEGFELLSLTAPEVRNGVGAHRHTGRPHPLPAGVGMFRFVTDHDRPATPPPTGDATAGGAPIRSTAGLPGGDDVARQRPEELR